MRKSFLFAAIFIVFAAVLSPAEEETSRLTLQVLREQDKKPVPNAHVVVKFMSERLLKDKRTSWEAKTNRNGVLVLNDLPAGSIKIQVIAKGYQTSGNDYVLSKPQEELSILLKPPQGQFSSYPTTPSQ
ncbi:MAG: carboxypeptidase regulatory-like domain-containing protein [Acidobacteria bacterium]|nr:carboxypeptidase regulatory-like domain-containing protein [Acidobacteriota bacterium]